MVLIGGLVLANYGGGVTPAEAHYRYQNPFKQILSKLNEILVIVKTLSAGGAGGGGGAGNQTLRWDTNNTSARFTTAFTGAVLDNNTGLVWELAPSTIVGTLGPVPITWTDARMKCVDKNVGAREGGRCPRWWNW